MEEIVTKAMLDTALANFTSGGIPIFETLAEAEAYEAANPGKSALTIENVTPDTTAPVAGAMSMSMGDVFATGTVSGAADNRGVTGYAFRVGSGAWSSWQSSSVYTFTGLTPLSSYNFQHKTRDAAGNETLGVSVAGTTLAVMPVTNDYTYRWLGAQAGGAAWVDTVAGLSAPLSGTAPTIQGKYAVFESTAGTYGPFTPTAITSATPTYVAVWQTLSNSNTSMGGPIGAYGVTGAFGIFSVGGNASAMHLLINGGQQGPNIPLVADTGHVGIARYSSGSNVMTYDGANYANNTSFATPAISSTPVNLAFQGGGTNFIGRIAEVRIYNRRLTDNEVVQLTNELRAEYGIAA